ncbi:acrosomal protein KIAA1210 homolog [Lacerta agilis]|uniref:acrosomal protein KIAA1210 homolog n=1 Tax=Lacerta agilis TaxID=80427 RepID=UPI00141A31E2|nr:acrosomal protein KIAA1210 homolog [Lacerta agilis]
MAGFYSCLNINRCGRWSVRSHSGYRNRDCVMATGSVYEIEPFEVEETEEECSKKKKSKFQTFKDFFSKKKKNKEQPSSLGEIKLKPSQSSSDVRIRNLDSCILHLPIEPGSKGNMGNKALSHDSVFTASSQENLPGKVKALQLRLQQNLMFGSPPLVIPSKRMEEVGAISEDDGLPRSPMELSTLHDVLICSVSESSIPAQRYNSLSLGGTDSEDDQVTSESASRPLSPQSSAVVGSPTLPCCHLLPVDFSSPPTPLGCLNTSAAKHKIAINPRKQKAFIHKNQVISVEEVAKQQGLLKPIEGKSGHEKLLEEDGRKEGGWPGLSIQNTSNLNGSQTNDALSMTRASDALHYSWNTGPGAEENCRLESENQNRLETDLQASVTVSCPNAQSSQTKHKEEEMEEEGVKTTGQPTDNLTSNSQSSVKEIIENVEPLQPETEDIRCLDVALPGNSMAKDLDAAEECHNVPCLQPVDQKAKDSSDGSDAIHIYKAEDGLGDGDSLVTLQAAPALHSPQFSASTMEAPSEAEKAVASALEKHQTPKEVTGGQSADMESQLCKGHTKQTAFPQGGPAISDAQVDELPLQSAMSEKPFHPNEPHCSDLNSSRGGQEDATFRNLSNPSLVGLASAGSPKVAPKSSSSGDKAGDLPGSVKMEESKGPDEIAKAHPKSTSAKPARFTIASAWQRSLSGGSSSMDSSCPGSTPSSPIRPELFEGMPQLDAAAEGYIVRSPECLDKGNGTVGANLNSANEWPKEETLDRESPFGVKLRRTPSLLKYRTQQKHHEPANQLTSVVPGTSSTLVKEDLMPPSSGKPPQNLTGGTKASVPKPTFQKENHPIKASKPDEDEAKQQIGKLSGQTPAAHLESTSSEPAWILMAKLKQKGFQGHPLAKGQKWEDKTSAKTEQGGEKHSRVSQQEKAMTSEGTRLHHPQALVGGARNGQQCLGEQERSQRGVQRNTSAEPRTSIVSHHLLLKYPFSFGYQELN